MPANPSPPETTSAPALVATEEVLLDIVVVPPINALPETPKPPTTTRDAAVVDDAFMVPPIVTPEPAYVIKLVPLTADPFTR